MKLYFQNVNIERGLIEKWKETVDKDQSFGTLLTDLSKAFDCLSHDFLIVELISYRISLASLKLLTDYLTNRKQRTKVETYYSSWEEIKRGVPQGSILDPLLFNIFVCDMFLMLDHTYFTSYAADHTTYTVNKNAEEVIRALEQISKLLLQRFIDYKMKLNPDKCHLSGNENGGVNVGKVVIKIREMKIY